MRLEPAVDLDGMNMPDAVGEVRGQNAETGPDLERHVGGVELGQPADHAEDVLVHEEVLAEIAVRRDGPASHGRANAALAFTAMRAASSSASSPRASASAATVWTTFAGSFGRPRSGWGEEVGAVGLGEDAVGRDVRGALTQVGRLRIRDVPGKRDVVAALEGGLEERRRGEAVQDHRSLKAPQGRERVLVGRACVHDDRLAELVGEPELPLEEAELGVVRRVVAEVIEAGLADGNGSLVREEVAQLTEPLGLVAPGFMRMNAERREDAWLCFGGL